MATLHIRQRNIKDRKYSITLLLRRTSQADLEANAEIEFALTPDEQKEIRWYMEDYLLRSESIEEVQVEEIEKLIKQRGEELYTKVLTANLDTQALWFAAREQLANLRVQITTGIAEAASIPWELMRDPQAESAIALRVRAFVRVQSDPSISFVSLPQPEKGRVRLLYIVCRPGGRNDVELRAVANRLLHDLGKDIARFDITALRPPTFEQLQKNLHDANAAGRPFHIVHFDGHGIYEDLSKTTLSDWLKAINALMLGGKHTGKQGYLIFEHPESEDNMRPVSGTELGQLLHDTGVPVLVLNACQSALQETVGEPDERPDNSNIHDEIRAIGSLAQAVVDQGIPAVLGMRYSVFVVTAAQYIGHLYAALAQGRPFGQAASEGRKHLALNPDRWIGLHPRPLQDWFVPIVYEAASVQLLSPKVCTPSLQLDQHPELDPVQTNGALRRYVPDTGFVGRDETLILIDRAFDKHQIVLLHAYAGQGKSATAVEFARWYAQTGGLGAQPVVLLTSFETHTDLTDVLNQIGQSFATALKVSGIEWHAMNDNHSRCKIVLQILRQIPILWIWDNVESVLGFPVGTESDWTPEEQTDLADFLRQIKLDRATQAKILLTSRRDEQAWLGDIAHRIEMPRMKNADAANLVRSISTERNISNKVIGDWQPLLDYCHGNPLTLRVIVGQAIKMGLRSKKQIGSFVEAIRRGEQDIEDADEKLGRDKSLTASLDFGYRNAFKPDEQPIIALLHLFQGTVITNVLLSMSNSIDQSLSEIKGWTNEKLTSVLDRARDNGLLSDLDGTLYTIHPALPWFLHQLFDRHFDGKQGRSTSTAVRLAWVEAIVGLSNELHYQSNHGNRNAINILFLIEPNLLHAFRTACQYGWWSYTLGASQGLEELYDYQNRVSDWSRIVAKIEPYFCTPDDNPIPGREDGYRTVMHYRAELARNHEVDLSRAIVLSERLVAFNRQQAATALSVPNEEPLNSKQRNIIRDLGVALEDLGRALLLDKNPDCTVKFEEALSYYRRVGDKSAEANAYRGLGSAYLRIPTIKNFDAAETAYKQSLSLFAPEDMVGRFRVFSDIADVRCKRLYESIERDEDKTILQAHFDAAEKGLKQTVLVCPSNNFKQLAIAHNNLGAFYSTFGLIEEASFHLEISINYSEKTGDRLFAGTTRLNLSQSYLSISRHKAAQAHRRKFLRRAQAYAQAALRDLQHQKGCSDYLDLCQEILNKIDCIFKNNSVGPK